MATVSAVSIKDAVSAGQKAAVQRELQSLNTTLQRFTATGGVIPEGAGVVEALDALKGGVDLTGSEVEFNPLANLPPHDHVHCW